MIYSRALCIRQQNDDKRKQSNSFYFILFTGLDYYIFGGSQFLRPLVISPIFENTRSEVYTADVV